MKWYHYLICLVLIVCGIISAVKLTEIFSVKSSEYGSVITFESENDLDIVSKYNLEYLNFESNNYIDYSCVITDSPVEFDGSDKDYLLIFNNQVADNVVLSNGKISGTFKFNFYDLDNQLITTSIVNIVIKYYSSETEITATTKNENNSLAYLNSYMNINGCVLKVVERSK